VCDEQKFFLDHLARRLPGENFDRRPHRDPRFRPAMLRAMASRGAPSLLLRPRGSGASARRIQCVRFRVGASGFGGGEANIVDRRRVSRARYEARGVGLVFPRARGVLRDASSASAASGDGETAVGAADGGVAAAREAQTNRYHRFYVDEPLPPAGGVVLLGRDESKHAMKALRLKPGDFLEVCDGVGGVGVGELIGTEPSEEGGRRGARDAAVASVALDAVAVTPFGGPEWHLVVACGGLKGGRADWLVEKSAELGAASLVPLKTERSPTVGADRGDRKGKGKRERRNAAAAADDDDDDASLSGREGRWSRVASAASKQCLRAHALRIDSPMTFDELVERVRSADLALLAAAGAPPLRSVLENTKEKKAGGFLVVGPEGDFTDDELARLEEAGAIAVGLGPLRLRVETAAVAIMACVGMMHPAREPPAC
jgi:16S rRNA (uracil1498-N3)-methyltransferase